MASKVFKPGNALFNLADIILDPESAAGRLQDRSSWLYPLIIVSVAGMMIGSANLPILASVIETSLPPGLPDDQVKQYLESFVKYQKIGIWFGPAVVLLKWLSSAGLLFFSCTLLEIKTGFKAIFGLISQCGLITLLQDIAVFSIIRLRAEPVQNVMDLSPRMGLDLLFPNAGQTAALILNYFSVFNFLYFIVLIIALAALGRSSRIRVFFAVLPLWLLPLCFGLAMLLFGNRNNNN